MSDNELDDIDDSSEFFEDDLIDPLDELSQHLEENHPVENKHEDKTLHDLSTDFQDKIVECFALPIDEVQTSSKPKFIWTMPPKEERWLGFDGNWDKFWKYFHQNANVGDLFAKIIPEQRAGALSLISKDWNERIQTKIMEPFYKGDPWKHRLSSAAFMGTDPTWFTPEAFKTMAEEKYPRSQYPSLPNNLTKYAQSLTHIFQVQKIGKNIWNKFLYGEPQYKDEATVFNGDLPAEDYRKVSKLEKSPRSKKAAKRQLSKEEKQIASDLQMIALENQQGLEERKKKRQKAKQYANDLYVLEANDVAPIYLDDRNYNSEEDMHEVFNDDGSHIGRMDTNTLIDFFPLDKKGMSSVVWDSQIDPSYPSAMLYARTLREEIERKPLGHARSLNFKLERIKRKIVDLEEKKVKEHEKKKKRG
eukprot:TRINITY_DN3332_c0_g1_i3.p1 TRINITY_DN3332_c0_g1~~TRINITY_DN3332_c0_g1_i3.p1  ORF type:complete len:418 (+),score=122.40 TRINITY_DN3332_c0_g1_i3:43-1296(+)